MNKVKVRCSVCGKSFKTPSLKKTICPSCDAEAKRARHQQPPSAAAKPAVASTVNVDVRAALKAAQENQGQFGAYRPPASATAPASPSATAAATPLGSRAPAHGAPAGARPARPQGHAGPRPAGQRGEGKPRAPKAPREKKPRIQTKPFEPTPEQVEAIRQRYLELAQPEFDGIRHQIATEVGVPLRAVKEVVKHVRDERALPSWWDRGGALPSPEELEKVRALYVPLLPDPEIGVHKRIAAQLKLTNTSVYHAIGMIRTEMELPRYNPREETPTQTAIPAADAHVGEIGLQPASGE